MIIRYSLHPSNKCTVVTRGYLLLQFHHKIANPAIMNECSDIIYGLRSSAETTIPFSVFVSFLTAIQIRMHIHLHKIAFLVVTFLPRIKNSDSLIKQYVAYELISFYLNFSIFLYCQKFSL